jgi:uncharacterized protein YoxC
MNLISDIALFVIAVAALLIAIQLEQIKNKM